MLTNIELLDESVVCENPTIPPLCMDSGTSDNAPSQAVVPTESNDDIQVGDEVCITGYITDTYCIGLGHFLDNKDLATLEYPEEHSYHCLLDVGLCIDSGYNVLGEKDEDTGLHCLGFRLDDTDAVLSAGRAVGRPGDGFCTTCEGGDDTSPTRGYRATVKGT
eukprot:1804908-Ditylum_brightwellii.AAC.1